MKEFNTGTSQGGFNNLNLFVLHILAGVVGSFSSLFVFIWGLMPIVIGLYQIIIRKNRFETAAIWAAYAAGIEVLLRMREGFLTFEACKYYVIILLFTGLIVEGGFKKSALVFLILLMLLIPSIFLTDLNGPEYRKAILFNLSGPLTLIASGIYFYNRPITGPELNKILVYFLLPILSTVVVLQLNTPDFNTIEFNAESNFETSGGFGPNQVSTITGFGAFLVALAIVLKFRITGYRIFDLLILVSCLFRGIITFSRGGVISVAIAFGVFVTGFYLFNQASRSRFLKYLIILIPAAILIWNYSVDVTKGQIENRYLGLNARGKEENNLTSGRTDIFTADYKIFLDKPLFGAGVGMSKIIRERQYGYLAASHSEFSRLLAEHGSLGVLFLLVIMATIGLKLFNLQVLDKIWMITFVIYSWMTINHAAMRTALPGLTFGMAFILFVNPVKRKI